MTTAEIRIRVASNSMLIIIFTKMVLSQYYLVKINIKK